MEKSGPEKRLERGQFLKNGKKGPGKFKQKRGGENNRGKTKWFCPKGWKTTHRGEVFPPKEMLKRNGRGGHL